MKYTSLIFLLLLILVIYFNHKNINRLTISSLVLFLFYIIICQQYYEHFDKSLEHLDNFSRNPEENKKIAQKLFNNETLDLDTCYKELIKESVLDNYKSFFIENNNNFLTFEINNEKQSVYLIGNKTEKYPPTTFYIKYINKALNRVNEKEFLCTFNISAKVKDLDYYLEYNYENEKVLPTLNNKGTKQTWVLKKNKENFHIKTLDGRFLAKGNKNPNETIKVVIKNLPDESCNWKLSGIEKSTCKKENEKVKDGEKCCSYLVEHKNKCILGSELPTLRNTDYINNNPNSSGKQGVWMPSFNKIWNGYYSSKLTNPTNYIDNSKAIQVKLDNFNTDEIFSKGTISIPMKIRGTGKYENKIFNINSFGSNILNGKSTDEKYEVTIKIISKDNFNKLFRVPLSNLDLNNKIVKELTIKELTIKELTNSVVINVVVEETKSKSIIMNEISFKLNKSNMDKKFISIFEAINSVDL